MMQNLIDSIWRQGISSIDNLYSAFICQCFDHTSCCIVASANTNKHKSIAGFLNVRSDILNLLKHILICSFVQLQPTKAILIFLFSSLYFFKTELFS